MICLGRFLGHKGWVLQLWRFMRGEGVFILIKKKTIGMRLSPFVFLSQSVSRGTEKRGC